MIALIGSAPHSHGNNADPDEVVSDVQINHWFWSRRCERYEVSRAPRKLTLTFGDRRYLRSESSWAETAVRTAATLYQAPINSPPDGPAGHSDTRISSAIGADLHLSCGQINALR